MFIQMNENLFYTSFVLFLHCFCIVFQVQVDVYYETYCGDSIRFINEQLWPTYRALMQSNILKLNLYPYGKAHQVLHDGRWQFTCQHKEKECKLNLIEACVKGIYIHRVFMSFVHCLATKPSMERAKSCADGMLLEWDEILKCTVSKYGNDLQHKIGVKTESLNPKLTMVPWIVVDGKSSEAFQKVAWKNFKRLVCSTYKGPMPEACHSL